MSTIFIAMCKASNLPSPVVEHRFCERRWRFDYAWLDQKLALEVEGGIWTGGRHTRGKGFLADMTKYNRATVLGWRIIRCTPWTLCSNETLGLIKEALSFSQLEK